MTSSSTLSRSLTLVGNSVLCTGSVRAQARTSIDTKTRTLFYGANPRIRPFSASPKDVELPGMEDDRIQMKRDSLPVTFADISRAMVTIRNGVKKTTCEKSYFLSELIGANVFLKTEFRQFTGSFKERGARNALLHHLRNKGDSFKTKGAIAASAGNHALGLAYHGTCSTSRPELSCPCLKVCPF